MAPETREKSRIPVISFSQFLRKLNESQFLVFGFFHAIGLRENLRTEN